MTVKSGSGVSVYKINVYTVLAAILYMPGTFVSIGVARGCTGCTCTPSRAEKKLGPNLQGKVVSAPPGRACTPKQSKSAILWENWGYLDGGNGYLVAYLVALKTQACVLRATTKKSRQIWEGKKSAPPEKTLATAMICIIKCCDISKSFSIKIENKGNSSTMVLVRGVIRTSPCNVVDSCGLCIGTSTYHTNTKLCQTFDD